MNVNVNWAFERCLCMRQNENILREYRAEQAETDIKTVLM